MNTSFNINDNILNAINSKGDFVHEVVNQNTPLLTAQFTQSGTTNYTLKVLDKNFSSDITLTRIYPNPSGLPGFYQLISSTPIFGTAAQFYAENIMYFDTNGICSMMHFRWAAPNQIYIEVFDTTNVRKGAEVSDLSFKMWVYPVV